jgi:hypothetical protein
MDGLDVSVLLHGPERGSGIFRSLCRATFNGPYAPDLCPGIFLGLPSLEFSKQRVRCGLNIFGPTLTGRFGGGGFRKEGRWISHR